VKITDFRPTAIEGFAGDWLLVQVRPDEGIGGQGEIFPPFPLQE